MAPVRLAVLFALLCGAAIARGAEEKDLHGAWTQQEESVGIPKGTIWNFKADHTLRLTVVKDGKERMIDFKYELQGEKLYFETQGKKDYTTIVSATATDILLRDTNGTTIKLKRKA